VRRIGRTINYSCSAENNPFDENLINLKSMHAAKVIELNRELDVTKQWVTSQLKGQISQLNEFLIWMS